MNTEFKAFILKHRICLEAYLEKNYQLQFDDGICTSDPDLVIQNENQWLRLNIREGTINTLNIDDRYGDILTWEALKNSISSTSAIPIVEEKSKGLAPFKTEYYQKLEKLLKMVITRYEMKLAFEPSIKEYIISRGINLDLIKDKFNVGTPINYQRLIHSFRNHHFSHDELNTLLMDLKIVYKRLNKYCLPYETSIVVPVYDEAHDFQGFHGRLIKPGSKSKYFNTGNLVETVSTVLYGFPELSQQNCYQIILTKGIFDLFACFQNGYRNVLATLNQGISITQFEKIMNLNCGKIIVGWDSDKSKNVISGLMSNSLRKKSLKFTETDQSLDAVATNGTLLRSLIQNAKEKRHVSEKSKNIAARLKASDRLKVLTNAGQAFVVRSDNLRKVLLQSKGTHQKLKQYLINESKRGNTQLKGNIPFVRIPFIFIEESALGQLKSELRTLLFLLSKKSGNRPVRYNKRNLSTELALKPRALDLHLERLIDYKLLIKEPERHGNKVVYNFYPSTIQYVI